MAISVPTLSTLCPQALLYFWIAAIINILVFFRTKDMAMLIGAIIIVPLWTWIVNKMCKNNYVVLAWVFGLFPIAGVLINFFMGVFTGIKMGASSAVDSSIPRGENGAENFINLPKMPNIMGGGVRAYEGFEGGALPPNIANAVADMTSSLTGGKKEEKKDDKKEEKKESFRGFF